MLEVAAALADGASSSDLDVGLLFFGREELPITESALMPLFERCPAAATADLAIVMEPTDNAIEVGCLGNLNALVTVTGTAAHSARPWLGDNAIHARDRARSRRWPTCPIATWRSTASPSARWSTSRRSKAGSPPT